MAPVEVNCSHEWPSPHGGKHECIKSGLHDDEHECLCGETASQQGIVTHNDFAVGWRDGWLSMALPPVPDARFTREQALRLAAWLVVLAGYDDEDFARVLVAVRST